MSVHPEQRVVAVRDRATPIMRSVASKIGRLAEFGALAAQQGPPPVDPEPAVGGVAIERVPEIVRRRYREQAPFDGGEAA